MTQRRRKRNVLGVVGVLMACSQARAIVPTASTLTFLDADTNGERRAVMHGDAGDRLRIAS